MAAWRGTLAQKASLGFGAFFLLSGIIGLIVHPDFGTGSELSSELFIVDWNGWHAVSTLMLAAIAFIAAVRPVWAVAFLAFNAVANANTAIWALFDSTPLGILDLPNVTTDVVLHLLLTAVSIVAVVAQISRDRRARHPSGSGLPLAS
jgi:hypothetical protein